MPAELISSTDLVVSLDYGQFSLHTGDPEPDLEMELLEIALDAGIAQRGELVVITSPHQNNFAMPLRVESWSSQPHDDVEDWEEAFEVHLDVADHGLVYGSPTMDFIDLPVPPGRYQAQITARGFVAEGWPGTTTPGDHWRIRLWPSDGPAQPKRLRGYSEPELSTPAPEHTSDGTAAVTRIHRALDAGTEFSGSRGTVRVERLLPGTRRALFGTFCRPDWLLTNGGSGDETGYTIHGGANSFGPTDDANLIVACNGEIDGELIAKQSPAFVEFTWTWLRLPPDRLPPEVRDGRPGAVLVPDDPQMTLRFELDNAAPAEHWATTLVRVTHDQVPLELVEDLTAYWHWVLERADFDHDVSGARRKHDRSK